MFDKSEFLGLDNPEKYIFSDFLRFLGGHRSGPPGVIFVFNFVFNAMRLVLPTWYPFVRKNVVLGGNSGKKHEFPYAEKYF